MDFFQTGMGQKYYNRDFPKMIKAMDRLAEAMEKSNQLKEEELLSKRTAELGSMDDE